MTSSVFDLVKRGQQVAFTHAQGDALWYVTSEGVPFPVPMEDIGDATFPAVDKALLFLRYLRPHWEAHGGGLPRVPWPEAHAPIRFTHYRQGQLWYATAEGESFPVPYSADRIWPACDSGQDPVWSVHQQAHRNWIETARQAALTAMD